MRTVSISFVIIVVLSAATAAVDLPVGQIHVGPVYTRGEQAGAYPKYPEIQIEVDVPPAASQELLKPEAFHIKADGGAAINATQEQTLASTGYGIAASVALDVSGSMKGKPLNAVRSGLIEFVGNAGPQDKVAIQTIADESHWDADWDAPRDRVRDALNRLATRGTLTRLWDSLLIAIQHLPVTPLSRHLIVISDGHDEGSSHTEDEVISAAHDHGMVVDAIGITRSNPQYLEGLDRLATQTGGQFREAKDSKDLENLIGSGIQRLKSTPVVSFRLADLPADGKAHRFEVTWTREASQWRGTVVASIPATAPGLTKFWYWGIGFAAAILLLLLIFILVRGRRVSKTRTHVESPSNRGSETVFTNAASRQSPLPPQPFVNSPDPVPAPLPPRKAFIATDETPALPKSKTEIMVRFSTPTKSKPAAWLVGAEGPAAGNRFPVDEIEYWIGTLENNHLQLADDPTVSGNHACLVFEHEVLGLYDYHSTNGTRVNGELIADKRRLLRPGDRIRIGRTTFILQSASMDGQPHA
jgi:hypothetical protein